ncbi:MAG: DegT/DnrJ/EryC1/StrS family aminotransferase, partial [Clostridia bacterium]|nr:DegT/DnrJ/EryC1/StrS family aminotransferase [Clostridia bacterium]
MANLAIKGGEALYTKGFPAWALSTPEDKENLKATYASGDWGTDGEQNRRFAADFAAYSGVKHCIPVANGT